MRGRAFLGIAVVLVVACSGGRTTSPGTATTPPVASMAPSPVATPSPAAAATALPAASDAGKVLMIEGRPVAVFTPTGYDPGRPAPLLIVLHGYGSSGREHDEYFHLGELAAERGFLYAHPDGTRDDEGNRFWNATDACCNFNGREVDDVTFLDTVIGEIGTSFAVDPKRVYLIGHSNGGFMSFAMACKHADTVAAIISLAGATFAKPADCAPSTPVAILAIHGTADDTILFDGGTIDLGTGPTLAPYPGAEASVATWAKYDGCATSAVTDERVDVDADVSVDGSPAEGTVTRWAGCQPGGAAELWTLAGAGHGPDISDAFPAAALDFFETHPKP